MNTVPTPDDDGPDPFGVAVVVQRYLERTGVTARITPANEQAVLAAARELITAFASNNAPAPEPGRGWTSGPAMGGDW